MKQFNNSLATNKLRQTISEGKIVFSVDDANIDSILSDKFGQYIDYAEDGSYEFDQDVFDKFVDYVESSGLDSNKIYVHGNFQEQGSVTGAEGPYLASLHATKKQRNPFAEDEMSGYKEMKGFRAGHTKDTGGFQYKDLWNVNEEYETEERLKVTLKGDVNYNKIGDVIDIAKDGKYYTLQFKNGKTAIYHQSDVTKPAGQKSFEDKPELKIDEDDIQEAYIPDNIKSFAKRKQITGIVNQVARWAEKAGKRIVGGTAIGKNYSTLILDLTYQGGEVRINTDNETIDVNGDLVDSYSEFLAALGENDINETLTKQDYEKARKLLDKLKYSNSKLYNAILALVSDNIPHSGEEIDQIAAKAGLQENYSRFKKETVTRSKEQQMHEAMKLVRKKLYEADKVMTYVKTMKEELGLQEYKSHTSKLMEKLQVSIAEIYKKYKEIK